MNPWQLLSSASSSSEAPVVAWAAGGGTPSALAADPGSLILASSSILTLASSITRWRLPSLSAASRRDCACAYCRRTLASSASTVLSSGGKNSSSMWTRSFSTGWPGRLEFCLTSTYSSAWSLNSSRTFSTDSFRCRLGADRGSSGGPTKTPPGRAIGSRRRRILARAGAQILSLGFTSPVAGSSLSLSWISSSSSSSSWGCSLAPLDRCGCAELGRAPRLRPGSRPPLLGEPSPCGEPDPSFFACASSSSLRFFSASFAWSSNALVPSSSSSSSSSLMLEQPSVPVAPLGPVAWPGTNVAAAEAGRWAFGDEGLRRASAAEAGLWPGFGLASSFIRTMGVLCCAPVLLKRPKSIGGRAGVEPDLAGAVLAGSPPLWSLPPWVCIVLIMADTSLLSIADLSIFAMKAATLSGFGHFLELSLDHTSRDRGRPDVGGAKSSEHFRVTSKAPWRG
mmetsp:Transcript_70969/g.183006  ORF Transcript_70969/g.183006 Transcript_70969/m.183006 type:complete len:452 (+) Transcript_70969:284-1639(+)